jgi:hypothetical protein
MVDLSIKNAAKAGVSDKATFRRADLFETDFSKASVLTLFLLRDINVKLRPKILDMKPGTRVVSNTFTMDDWEPEQVSEVADCSRFCKALFWIVPAKVGGTWRAENVAVNFEQKYQMITGTVTSGNVVAPLTGRLKGEEITFTAGGTTYTGKVNGNRIEGTSTSGSSTAPWRVTRG